MVSNSRTADNYITTYGLQATIEHFYFFSIRIFTFRFLPDTQEA